MKNKKISDECCPKFDPLPWGPSTGSGQGIKKIEWQDKKFIKDSVFTLFYMPLNFEAVMTRSTKKINDAGEKLAGGLILSEHKSAWKMNVYLAVDKKIPNAENTTISGKFVSKVYEGEFKETGNWMKDFENYTRSKMLDMEKMYLWYTTCPKCAQKYGKNYVVILGKIK